MSKYQDSGDQAQQMVYRSMAHAKDCLLQARRAWVGTTGQETDHAREVARRELHAATMAYLDNIRRFRRKDLGEFWNGDIPELSGEISSLDNIADHGGFGSVTVMQTQQTDSGRAVQRPQQRPWMLTLKEADAVIKRLDDCAVALGYDDSPESSPKRTGAGAPDSPEEMEHINNEVVINGD